MPVLSIGAAVSPRKARIFCLEVCAILERYGKNPNLLRAFFGHGSTRSELFVIASPESGAIEDELNQQRKALLPGTQPINIAPCEVYRGDRPVAQYRSATTTCIAAQRQAVPKGSACIAACLTHPAFSSGATENFKQSFATLFCSALQRRSRRIIMHHDAFKDFPADDVRFFFRKDGKPAIEVFYYMPPHINPASLSKAVTCGLEETIQQMRDPRTLGFSEGVGFAHNQITLGPSHMVLMGDRLLHTKSRGGIS